MLQVKFVGRHPLDWPHASGTVAKAESEAQSSSPPPTQQTLQGQSGGPSTSTSASANKAPTITTDRQLRADFVAYLYDRLHNDNGLLDDGNRMTPADTKKLLWSAIVVAADPSSSISTLNVAMAKTHCQQPAPYGGSLVRYFDNIFTTMARRIQQIDKFWNSTTTTSQGQKRKNMAAGDKREDEDEVEDENDDEDESKSKHNAKGKGKGEGEGGPSATSIVSGTVPSRPAGDHRAQKIVPAWYNNRCVLSGVPLPDAAHIVPVRLTQLHDNLIGPWNVLGGLWPLPELEELLVAGQEVTNILPLNAATHRQWDRYQFALRPIAVPDDVADTPPRRIWIQMVWLDDEAPSTAATSQRDHRRWGGLVDFRRPDEHGHFMGVEHGDVYLITTTDPERWPLPSLRLLEMQFGAHKLMGGMRAAAVLRDIFSGDPPDDDDDDFGVRTSLTEDDVPSEWRSLIDAAVDKNILGSDAAQKWKTAAAVDYRWQLIRAGLAPHPDDDSLDSVSVVSSSEES